ncbi:MAG: SDR family oxidoreductase [Aureispira sp.]|nr:SDR family oxidoreductase [Aureispira sp.]
MFADNLLKDQVALVTGGRSGIGYAIAETCLKYGAKVIIVSRKEELLKEAAEKLNKLGECSYFAADIRNIDLIKSLAEFIKEKYGRLDLLFNNAGGQFPSTAEDISHNGWNAVINNNLNGTWYVTQTMANSFFLPQKSGIIVNVIANIYRGFPGMSHTGAARAGVDNLTKTLAVEWSRKGVRINAVAPGIIQSSGLETYPEGFLDGISETIPMKRLGSCQEVTDLCIFLASPMGAYITGETVYIDGGQRLWGSMFELD